MTVRTIQSLLMAICLVACANGSAATPSSRIAGTTPTPRPSAHDGGAGQAVPDGFPLMPGMEPVTHRRPEPGILARWITDADGSAVYDFYVAALPVAGFRVEQLFPGGAAAVIRFRPHDGRLLDLSLTPGIEGTQVDLEVPAAKP